MRREMDELGRGVKEEQRLEKTAVGIKAKNGRGERRGGDEERGHLERGGGVKEKRG